MRFYPLIVNNGNDDGYNNVEWEEVDYFPNINRSPMTPVIALSSKVAVVGVHINYWALTNGRVARIFTNRMAPRVDGSGWMY